MNKNYIIEQIIKRLNEPLHHQNKGDFKFWVIDNLLPQEIAISICDSFPSSDLLRERNTLREYKRVGVDFENDDP